MNIKVLETSIDNGQQYDISEIVSDLRWTTGLNAQPGTLEFSILEDANVFLNFGDIIELKIDGKKIFKGKVFTRKKSKNKSWTIKSYDNLRYLKNEDCLVFGASSVSERFKRICQIQGVSHKVLNSSNFNCVKVINDNHTYYSMLEDAIGETRKATGNRFGFWDNFGTIELFNLTSKVTNIVLGDESMMTDYDYEASIDEVYNVVKVVREDTKTKKRQIFTARHEGNIRKWGKLQMVEKISDADLNSAQLQKKANDLLKTNNREKKTLSFDSIGVIDLRAGNSFILRLSDLKNDGVGRDQVALITKCSHFFGSEYSMSLELEV